MLLRLIYFVLTFVGLAAGTALVGGLSVGRSLSVAEHGAPILQHTVLTAFPTSPFWILTFVLSVLGTLLGPWAYRRRRDRGRGQLEAIRALSQMPLGTGRWDDDRAEEGE